MKKPDYAGQERRKYLRLDTVFPVRFRIESPDGKAVSSWLQGFTGDVGKGGICLSVSSLEAQNLIEVNTGCRMSLEIELPVLPNPVKAVARSAWVREISAAEGKYLIGLRYLNIEKKDNNRIMSYAWGKKIFIPFALSIVALLTLGVFYGSYLNMKLEQGNKALVEKLVSVTQEAQAAKKTIDEINKSRLSLEENLSSLEKQMLQNEAELKNQLEKEKLEKQVNDNIAAAKTNKKIAELSALSKQLAKDKQGLLKQLTGLKERQQTVSTELETLGRQRSELEKENFEKMYKWLTVHQNKHSGLVMSFEGDGNIANWAFTYDQALAIQAFVYFGDSWRAKRMLDFFKGAQKAGNLVYNAYYADGGEPAEYTVHCGPNIWLGIACVQYYGKTRDSQYLSLAESIASGIIALQDSEGGLPGGPGTSWYSTEHNLDAYAFFNMLYKITQKDAYAVSRDRVLKWLVEHTYDTGEIPIKRGRGDSTIATDTYAWSIAAIGPERLIQAGMDPDKIMQFAEDNCAVEVTYTRPEGRKVRVKGFDFAAKKNVARGGVISSEWTAQMVISYKIMADFHTKRQEAKLAQAYSQKADEYLLQLTKMIISSPSPSGQGESCLPYASQDSVDTGHGWTAPKGCSTGSLSGTVYTVFAYYNYNPLELKD